LYTELAVLALAIGGMTVAKAAAPMTKTDFGKTKEGTPVQIFTLTNGNGMEAKIMTYGGIVVSLKAPDRNGAMADIVLGFDSLKEYEENNSPYFGALIGRYGNRIGHARFSLDGKEYTLEKNNGENTLHGGSHGFNTKVWTPKQLPDGGLELTYVSPDGEEGFPGTLTLVAVYRLTAANELKIDYAATTGKPTVVNPTNHSYFNLKGAGNGDILGHVVTIYASRFTPVDAGLIPTGELRPVKGTPFDFTRPTAVGARIGQSDEQLKFGTGYDHNWVLDSGGGKLALAAKVEEPTTGRVLEVLTTEPGIQFYTGNFLDGTLKGKGGKVYAQRNGLALETQHFPDSPNKPAFPSTTLRPGQKFQSQTVYRFSTEPAGKK
jgi:aldose 1-epimerase